MIGQIQSSQNDMKSLMDLESPYLADRARNNVLRVESFALELNEECKVISERIVNLRNKIVENIGGQTNFDGFCLGDIDDYIDEFDF